MTCLALAIVIGVSVGRMREKEDWLSTLNDMRIVDRWKKCWGWNTDALRAVDAARRGKVKP